MSSRFPFQCLLQSSMNWLLQLQLRICQPKTEGQIQNGTEQNNCDDCVDNLFKKAQKVGAVCSEHAKADTVITLWKNGFTVNEGELRSYTDVANRCFLDSIKKGELPLELQKICDKEEVDVKMDDKKDKLYTSPKAVFHPFSGPGYRLGSATPRIISKVKKKVEETEERKPTVVLINSEPITRIQIWLADGARIVQNFNISHRISHIRDFIIDYQRHQGRRPFTLTTSLPFQELLNESLTLEEANLKNAVVVQRLKNNIEPFRSFSS
ncbi:UBX domain-containing protein 2A isoform X2 [Crotalus tigris]|uniref:UBX domain-containing protein 2A isoform X2 n=1 Tax=Crotalus tigris TaxID=88082 RepID=UPI00192FA52B|nr:UBX domain-containing protein 2A isoform X2 [Crotalus tigris]XP_039201819.1 UBX domain-containing protein 2A isoform X2 [Crotalus tigris]